jgi:hypothetical protein
MIKTICTLTAVCGIGAMFIGNDPAIDVTEQTLKISGNSEEVLYYGFAEGDRILFSFSETNGKEIKEIEVAEYPSNSKFSDYKTSKIENKSIDVIRKAVYKFRFYNSSMMGRVCKIKIQRIPASEQTRNFNCAVNWEIKQDTTWRSYVKEEQVGFDTTLIPRTKRELVKTVQKEEIIFDKIQRVHSYTNSNGNRSSIFFTLPQNKISLYQPSRVISWAYWVGVGQEAQNSWANDVRKIGKLAQGAASVYTTPLGAFAVGAITELMVPNLGEDVSYSIADEANKDLFYAKGDYRVWDSGKGVAGYRKFTDQNLMQGTYYVLLFNDNNFQGIDVNVKVSAIVETKHYEDKAYNEVKLKPRFEKKIYRDPVITTSKVPVIKS